MEVSGRRLHAAALAVVLTGGGILAGTRAEPALALAGNQWYVDATNGSPAMTCAQNDRQHPFQTINQAMSCVAADAPPPSAPDLVHIAAGTYPENVAITGNVNLLGAGVGTTTIEGSVDNPSYTVGISGVTITSPQPSSGGGIYNNAAMTVTNSALTHNAQFTGGAIYNTENGTMALVNTPVSGNQSDQGGGILNFGTMTLNNSPVTGNFSSVGGGIFNERGTMTLTNSRVSDNQSIGQGGGILNADGGTVTLNNSPVGGSHAFRNRGDPTAGNSARDDGGGIFNAQSTLTLLNSPVSWNETCGDGGGIDHIKGGTVSLQNSNVSYNVTQTSMCPYKPGTGGGIATDGSPLVLKNENIVHNFARRDGGGLFVGANVDEPDVEGAGDSCTGLTGVTMSNTIISQNTVDDC